MPEDPTPESEKLANAGDDRDPADGGKEPEEARPDPAASEDDTPLGDTEEAAGAEGASGKGEDSAPLPRERPYEPPPSTGAR
jgi:hypothetical protein